VAAAFLGPQILAAAGLADAPSPSPPVSGN
jgi:hypothetical protein